MADVVKPSYPRSASPTLGSSIDLLIGLSFKHVETLDPDAKHKHYRECGCCGGTDEKRDDYKPDLNKVEHVNDCPLARDLPILRAIGLASDASGVPAQGAKPCGVLWCCHVRGPDDVYAAPDYVTALAWSDAMNEINWKANSDLNIGDPKSFQDCLIKAVPAPWPYSPEAHAKNLPESIKGFSDPSAVSSTEQK